MRSLRPTQISGHVLALIREAKEELIVASPCVNLTYWQQPAAAIRQAIARGVRVHVYLRREAGRDTGQSQVEQLGLTPILVEHLPTAIYYNEATGLLTSMNLRHAAADQAPETGSQVETPAELAELRRQVQQLRALSQVNTSSGLVALAACPAPMAVGFAEQLRRRLQTSLDEAASVEERGPDAFVFTVLRNSFTLHVSRPANEVQLAGVISQREASYYKRLGKRHFSDALLGYQLLRRDAEHYNRISGTYRPALASPDFNHLPVAEAERLLDAISKFVRAVRAYKGSH